PGARPAGGHGPDRETPGGGPLAPSSPRTGGGRRRAARTGRQATGAAGSHGTLSARRNSAGSGDSAEGRASRAGADAVRHPHATADPGARSGRFEPRDRLAAQAPLNRRRPVDRRINRAHVSKSFSGTASSFWGEARR